MAPLASHCSYREDDGLYLESDTDEQLLIHVPFNSACKLAGLVVKSTKSPDQVGAAAGGPVFGLSVKQVGCLCSKLSGAVHGG